MKKTKGQEEASDVNYKQLAKVKYLTEQCRQLSALRKRLEQISVNSKELLQSLSKVRSKDETVDPQENDDKALRKLVELHKLMEMTRNELASKKQQLENRIAEADRNKKEDQLLYRRVLLNYEDKISELKQTVLNREGYIQRLQKDKRENKSIVIDKKLILANTSNLQLFSEFTNQSARLRNLARSNLQLKVQLNSNIDEIRRQENILLKLKMAKETKMPYYKFKDIIKNGIERMSDFDKEEFKFLTSQPKPKPQNAIQNAVLSPPKAVSNENLYLMLKKEEINGQILRSMIEEQTKKQDDYQQRNAKLKEALRTRQQQQMCQQIGRKINNMSNEAKLNRWQSMSVVPGSKSKRKQPYYTCSKEEYRMYLQEMSHTLKTRMIQIFHLDRKYIKRSKSQQPEIKIWPPRELDELRSTDIEFKESFYEKCNNFITERFYDDDIEYEVY